MLNRLLPAMTVLAFGLAIGAVAACDPGERRVGEDTAAADADLARARASSYFGGSIETARQPSGHRLDTDGDNRLDPIVNGYTKGHSWVGAPVRVEDAVVGRVAAVRYGADGGLDAIVIGDIDDSERFVEARLEVVGIVRTNDAGAAASGSDRDARADTTGAASLAFVLRDPLATLQPPRGLSVTRARFHKVLAPAPTDPMTDVSRRARATASQTVFEPAPERDAAAPPSINALSAWLDDPSERHLDRDGDGRDETWINGYSAEHRLVGAAVSLAGGETGHAALVRYGADDAFDGMVVELAGSGRQVFLSRAAFDTDAVLADCVDACAFTASQPPADAPTFAALWSRQHPFERNPFAR